MPTYVEIAVNVPQVSGVFHYHLPPELEKQVKIGHLVVVPFGKQKVQGVILQHVDEPAVPETRPVLYLVDREAVLLPEQIELAKLISDRSLSALVTSISLMLPSGLNQLADTQYSLVESKTYNRNDLGVVQNRIIDLLRRRGSLRGRQINRALPRVRWRGAIAGLMRRGILNAQPVLAPPSVRPKKVRTARLACDPKMALNQLDDLGKTGSKALKRRQAIINFLIRETGPTDVAWVYAESGGNAQDLRFLAERELIAFGESEVLRDPLAELAYDPGSPPPLTSDQTNAWNRILPYLQKTDSGKRGQTFLLHGVTGSGKTEIYLRAVAETLRVGGRAIVLVPEISLTPQTVKRFMARFPGQVGLIHSRLSQGERYDTWRRARTGDLSVIVGPRSALFTPLPDLKLIIVDESHDSSYYQAENPPFYNAREVAVDYAQLVGAVCILGSATPDMTSTHRAEQGEWQLLKLPERILAHRETVRAHMAKHGGTSGYKPIGDLAEFIELPPVSIIDMRDELKSGNRSIFSRAMREALQEVLERNQQAILFLNRRGTATYVFCRDCGYTLKCPQCDTSLTFHVNAPALTCHHCGYQRRKPEVCPQCQGTRIRQYGMGTERVESELREMFPPIKTLRWDWDTTRKKGAHDVILSNFSNQQADVLVGTQMLAKGLDLPLVTLVGVVLADVGLNLPDYRASERVFQILTQVAGRAGRSPLGGQVILQTFHPDNYVIQAASQHDYEAFYRREINFRQDAGYPPYSKLVRFEYRHRDPAKAEAQAARFSQTIRQWLDSEGARKTQIIGPVPCFYMRLRGQYRWQVILKGPDPIRYLKGRDFGEWRVEVDPQALL